MKLLQSYLVALACLAAAPGLDGVAQEAQPAKSSSRIEYDLKSTMTENVRSTQAEDLEAMMKTLHPQSPVYETTRQSVSQVFGKNLQLKYELVSLKFLAVDGDYALARIRQRTTRTPPESFRNNEIDMIVVFKQDDKAWKIWNQTVLEIKYLSP